ncbi:MAG: type II toxin-antitoxin system RelE/ParE family toxin [Thermomonas sp.]|nr:type II toxin-antitoxin system RelE/ParE family toxin [Thermomonas sp.]
MPITEVREYHAADGRNPFAEWMQRLRDRRAQASIVARILRLQAGNRGDWKAVGAGVFELRVDVGPGYRVYAGQDGPALVLLLCGGDKRTQANDIEVAHDYWQDYKTRSR